MSADVMDGAATGGPETGPGAGETLESVRKQRDEYYDLLLRKTAEFENYRKRIERERRDLSEYAGADILKLSLIHI